MGIIDDRQENTFPLPICFQNVMYEIDISHFANKSKRDCIFLSTVDVFAGVESNSIFSLWPLSRFVTKLFIY